MMTMAVSMMRTMKPSSAPPFQCRSSPCPSRNGWSCARPMTTARPFTKPTMTDPGMRVMYFEPPTSQNPPMSTPAQITEGKRSSTPSPLPPGVVGSGMKVAMMAAKAPVAPLIIPGRPPSTPQMRPTTQAECSAMGGRTFARKANATDSGICAKAMMSPSRTSVFT